MIKLKRETLPFFAFQASGTTQLRFSVLSVCLPTTLSWRNTIQRRSSLTALCSGMPRLLSLLRADSRWSTSPGTNRYSEYLPRYSQVSDPHPNPPSPGTNRCSEYYQDTHKSVTLLQLEPTGTQNSYLSRYSQVSYPNPSSPGKNRYSEYYQDTGVLPVGPTGTERPAILFQYISVL